MEMTIVLMEVMKSDLQIHQLTAIDLGALSTSFSVEMADAFHYHLNVIPIATAPMAPTKKAAKLSHVSSQNSLAKTAAVYPNHGFATSKMIVWTIAMKSIAKKTKHVPTTSSPVQELAHASPKRGGAMVKTIVPYNHQTKTGYQQTKKTVLQ